MDNGNCLIKGNVQLGDSSAGTLTVFASPAFQKGQTMNAVSTNVSDAAGHVRLHWCGGCDGIDGEADATATVALSGLAETKTMCCRSSAVRQVFVTSAIATISVGVELTAVNWAAAKSSQPFRTDVSGTKSPVRRASSTAMTLATTATDDRAERTFSRAPGRDVSANKQV